METLDFDTLLAQAEAAREVFDASPVPEHTVIAAMVIPEQTVYNPQPQPQPQPQVARKPAGRPSFTDPCDPKQTMAFISKAKAHFVPNPFGGATEEDQWTRITRTECKRAFKARDKSLAIQAWAIGEAIYFGVA